MASTKFRENKTLTTLGPVALSVKSLTADPGIASLIPTHSYTSMETDHEIISVVILILPLV